MKKTLNLTFLLLIVSCSYKPQFSKAFDYDVVYGNDNRSDVEISEILKNNPELTQEEAEKLFQMAKATAGMVELGFQVMENSDGSVTPIKPLRTLGERRHLCEGENFANEFILPMCTGFLVDSDLLATAGHCLNKGNYKGKVWIFGYDKKYSLNANPVFPKDVVYHTKEVILWEKNYDTQLDYALVRLDRKVEGVNPLKIRKEGVPEIGTSLAIIGHPSGLPSKISATAEILEHNEEFRIKTNLDSFSGNSGSPVINVKTGYVEGILVSGAADYIDVDSGESFCYEVSERKEEEGEEFITKITLIASSVVN